MIKGIAYFFIGFVSALIVVELTDGKPSKKVDEMTTLDELKAVSSSLGL